MDLRAVLVPGSADECREKTTSLLKQLGCHVDVVSTGRQAVEAVRNGGYDLVLVDDDVVDADACEIVEQIRALPRESGCIRVIVLFTGESEIWTRAGAGGGWNARLRKPVDLDDLRRLVDPETFQAREQQGGALELHDSEPVGKEEPQLILVREALARLEREIGGEGASYVIAQLTAAAREQLTLLREGIDDGRCDDIVSVAHRLKGTCLYLGASYSAELCGRVEETSEVNQIEKLGELFLPLEQSLKGVFDVVDEVRGRGGLPGGT